jgi:hypothetical protein
MAKAMDGLLVLPSDPDAQWCLKCGKDALDTGWECTECGYDCMPWYCPTSRVEPQEKG